MDELFTAASNHPLVTIIIVATALVVALYLIRKHFWRIFLVLVLTCIGYYLYANGYFTKEKLQGIKSVDFTKIEKGAEAGPYFQPLNFSGKYYLSISFPEKEEIPVCLCHSFPI